MTVVAGFLGAGKSTLMKAWLQQLPRGEVSVIVNERGDVGIDGDLLSEHVARLTEIAGGCVCCSSQGELVAALREFSSSAEPPRRILIETSGAASPAGVVRAVTALRPKQSLRLDGVITVVDCTRAQAALEFDLAVEQLGFADIVVLSHVDAIEAKGGAAELQRVRTELSRHAPAAVFADARRGSMDRTLEALLDDRVEALSARPSMNNRHSPIEAVSLVAQGELDEDRFIDWVETQMAAVEARILRVKGIVAVRGVSARVILQGVSNAVEVVLGRPWQDAERSSRIVVLGLGLDAAQLEAGFSDCVLKGSPSSAPK